MAVEFILIDRDTPYIFPPCVQDYLPEDHLARFVVDIVDQLDLSHLSAVYTGRGSKPFHPAMLVSLLFYGYATGVFSSRKLEKASYDSIAFRYICANSNPDHDTSDGAGEAGQRQPGWHQDQGQCQQAQGAELGLREPPGGAA